MLSRATCLALQRPIGALLARTSSTTPANSNATAAVTTTDDKPLWRRPVRAEHQGPVRFGFVPEEWFTFFYKKTGVTGPYAFGIGLFTYLSSKEILVFEHEWYGGVAFAILLTIGIKKIGPSVKKALDQEVDEIEAGWEEGRKQSLANLQQSIKDEETEQWRAEGELLLNEAHKETVALQLEAAYRERLAHVYNEVKRRLDYQVEIQQVERVVKQKHLVNWVKEKVLSSITPDQEKENLNRCIADLSALAARQ